ncbi:PDZ domain-containing protein [Methylomonas sp. HW2-6]|uniref:PDZ domain-containing protein n=1 Tax=Methylomonas sp. HW2-6 TaxID=3376687 RepID=UPI004042488A
MKLRGLPIVFTLSVFLAGCARVPAGVTFNDAQPRWSWTGTWRASDNTVMNIVQKDKEWVASGTGNAINGVATLNGNLATGRSLPTDPVPREFEFRLSDDGMYAQGTVKFTLIGWTQDRVLTRISGAPEALDGANTMQVVMQHYTGVAPLTSSNAPSTSQMEDPDGKVIEPYAVQTDLRSEGSIAHSRYKSIGTFKIIGRVHRIDNSSLVMQIKSLHGEPDEFKTVSCALDTRIVVPPEVFALKEGDGIKVRGYYRNESGSSHFDQCRILESSSADQLDKWDQKKIDQIKFIVALQRNQGDSESNRAQLARLEQEEDRLWTEHERASKESRPMWADAYQRAAAKPQPIAPTPPSVPLTATASAAPAISAPAAPALPANVFTVDQFNAIKRENSVAAVARFSALGAIILVGKVSRVREIGILLDGDELGSGDADCEFPETRNGWVVPPQAASLRKGDYVVMQGTYGGGFRHPGLVNCRILQIKRIEELAQIARPVAASSAAQVAAPDIQVGQGYIGVNLQDLAGKSGGQITQVTSQSPAAQAGLKAGDVILMINGKFVDNTMAIKRLIAASPNIPLNLDVLRSDNRLRVTVTPQLSK